MKILFVSLSVYIVIFFSCHGLAGEPPEKVKMNLGEKKELVPVNLPKRHEQAGTRRERTEKERRSEQKKKIKMEASKQELEMLDTLRPLINSWFATKVPIFAALMRQTDHLPRQTSFDFVWTCIKGSEYFHLIFIMRALFLSGEKEKAEMLANSLDYTPITRFQLLKWLALTDENSLDIELIDVKLQSLKTTGQLKSLIKAAKEEYAPNVRKSKYHAPPVTLMPSEMSAFSPFQQSNYMFGDEDCVVKPDLDLLDFHPGDLQHELSESRRERIICMLSEGNLNDVEYEISGRCLKVKDEDIQLSEEVKAVFHSFCQDLSPLSTVDHYGSLFEILAILSGNDPVDLFTDLFRCVEHFVLSEGRSDGKLIAIMESEVIKNKKRSRLLDKVYKGKWCENVGLFQQASSLMIKSDSSGFSTVTVRKFIHKYLWRNEQDLISLIATCNSLNMPAVVIYPVELSNFGLQRFTFSGVALDCDMMTSLDIRPEDMASAISQMSSPPVIFLCLGQQWFILKDYDSALLSEKIPEILQQLVENQKIKEKLSFIHVKGELKKRSGPLGWYCSNNNVEPCVCEALPCSNQQHIAYCLLLSIVINALKNDEIDIDALVETYFANPLLVNPQRKSKTVECDLFRSIEFTPEAIMSEVKKLQQTVGSMFSGTDKKQALAVVKQIEEIAGYLGANGSLADNILEKIRETDVAYDDLLQQCDGSVVASQMDVVYQLVCHHPLMRIMKITPHSLADINVCFSLLLRLCNLQSVSGVQKEEEDPDIKSLVAKVFEEQALSGFQKKLIDLYLGIRTKLPQLSLEPFRPVIEQVLAVYKSVSESEGMAETTWRSKQLVFDLDDSRDQSHEQEALDSATESTSTQLAVVGRSEGRKESSRQAFLFEQLCRQWKMPHVNDLCDDELNELAVDMGLNETLQVASSSIFTSDIIQQGSHLEGLLPASNQQEQSVALELQAVTAAVPRLNAVISARCKSNSCEWQIASNHTFTCKLTSEAYVMTHSPLMDIREFAQCSRPYRRLVLANHKRQQTALGEARGLLPLTSLLSVRNLTRTKTEPQPALMEPPAEPVMDAVLPKRPVVVSEESGSGYQGKGKIVTNSIMVR